MEFNLQMKQTAAIIALVILAIAGLVFDERELSWAAFGAISGWGLINGIKAKINKGTES